MKLSPEEPEAGPWRAEAITDFAAALLGSERTTGDGPVVVGIDGRSSAGKSTLARRIAETRPRSPVVHTDDVAWHHSRFGWTDLLVGGVIEPIRRGQPVSFRPPAWDERGRQGSIDVSADAATVIIEGVGIGRRELAPLLDVLVWVQSDLVEMERRNTARVIAGETTAAGVEAWMAEEFPFIADQRPWERADVIVLSAPQVLVPVRHHRQHDVVVARRRPA